MIKNLVIIGIPKDQESLQRVLKKVGDNTWSQEGIYQWSICDKTDIIFYDIDCDCYVWSNQGTKPVNPELVWKTFNQVVGS